MIQSEPIGPSPQEEVWQAQLKLRLFHEALLVLEEVVAVLRQEAERQRQSEAGRAACQTVC